MFDILSDIPSFAGQKLCVFPALGKRSIFIAYLASVNVSHEKNKGGI